MSQSVRTITVNPQLLRDQPEIVGPLLLQRMEEHPADLWLVMVAPRDIADQFSDNLFMYGPPEEPLEDPSQD